MVRIITIARGFGSGGRTIGRMLAQDLNIKYYDRDLIRLASDDSGINERFFGLVDEKLKSSFKRKGGKYKGDILDPSDPDFISDQNLFNYQAKVIKQLADKEPCVIVGRCADYILRDRADVLKLFIHADEQTSIKSIMEMYGVSQKEARKNMERKNRERSEYYKHYTGREWDCAENYNLCLDTSKLSHEECLDIIKGYMKIVDK